MRNDEEMQAMERDYERMRLKLFAFEVWASTRPPFPANSLKEQNALDKWIYEMPEVKK